MNEPVVHLDCHLYRIEFAGNYRASRQLLDGGKHGISDFGAALSPVTGAWRQAERNSGTTQYQAAFLAPR